MIVVIFFIAAVITPPDVVSQIMVAVPMICLYEISIWLSRLTRRRDLEQAS
jgi:sec-independent protein translocase protein TatC